MKKLCLFICLIAIALALNACSKCTYFYAYCETGHASWKGKEYESCHGDHYDSSEDSARMTARGHDDNVHGGIITASVRSEYR